VVQIQDDRNIKQKHLKQVNEILKMLIPPMRTISIYSRYLKSIAFYPILCYMSD